jgi:hypothetical protein
MTLNMPPLGQEPTICRTVDMRVVDVTKLNSSFPSVGKEGSNHHAWERDTWPALKEITEKYPEAGIHFLGMFLNHAVR